MSTTTRGLSTGQNPSWSLNFWNQVHRYRRLVQRHWWVLVFTLSVTLFFGAYYQISRPPTFLSAASMYQDVENRQVGIGGQTGDANPTAQVDNFLDQQLDIIKGNLIASHATEQVHARYPSQPPSPVRLAGSTSNGIMLLSAMGSDPLYTPAISTGGDPELPRIARRGPGHLQRRLAGNHPQRGDSQGATGHRRRRSGDQRVSTRA